MTPNWFKRFRWWIPIILAGLLMIGGISGLAHKFFMRALYLVVVFVVIPELTYLIFHRLTGRRAAICLACIPCLLFIYGTFWGFYNLKIREEVYESTSIPEGFDGFRIVHLSDLHLGSYNIDTDFIDRVVDSVNALKPDLIVFTGDLVNVKASEAQPFVTRLGRLSAPHGVLSVTGNHDYGYKTGDIEFELQSLQIIHGMMGWDLLLNESRIIRRGADSIFVAGVENTTKNFFISRGDLSQAISEVKDSSFCILLSHDPHHWRDEVLPESNVQLTLSGHTHAMQLKIFGLSPAALMFKEWSGMYYRDGRAINVSEGIGGIVPARIGAWPEIVVITLKKS